MHSVADDGRRSDIPLGAVRRALPRAVRQRDERRRAGDEDERGGQARAVGGK
jgi:hypothetical protein